MVDHLPMFHDRIVGECCVLARYLNVLDQAIRVEMATDDERALFVLAENMHILIQHFLIAVSQGHKFGLNHRHRGKVNKFELV